MADGRGVPRRLTKETKGASKTTEFRLTVAAIVLILISAFMIKAKGGHGDNFNAQQAWLYVAILVGAYSVGRGLAKSGVREYPEDVEAPKESRREKPRDDSDDEDE